jgi:hypothetical protein
MKVQTIYILRAVLVIGIVVTTQMIFAQPGGGPPVGGGNPQCWPPPCIPIDGGMSFLIAAGLAFGGKKLMDLRSK